MRGLLLTSLCVVALECSGTRLFAQEHLECTSWAATLAAGSLADTRSQERAYTRIQDCPSAIRGQAISRALERRSNVTSFNDLSTEVFALATRDEPVFRALLRMSDDRTASPTARVLAIATLLAMVDTHVGVNLDHFTRTREGEACITGGSPVHPVSIGGPLATDSTRQVVATFLRLERSRSTDPAVRSAANCAMNVLRQRELGQVAEIAPFERSVLAVRYKCGSNFVVTNRSPFTYLAVVRIPGAPRPRVLVIQGTRGKRATRETMFEGGAAASVDLVVDDVTYTLSNGHQGCARR